MAFFTEASSHPAVAGTSFGLPDVDPEVWNSIIMSSGPDGAHHSGSGRLSVSSWNISLATNVISPLFAMLDAQLGSTPSPTASERANKSSKILGSAIRRDIG